MASVMSQMPLPPLGTPRPETDDCLGPLSSRHGSITTQTTRNLYTSNYQTAMDSRRSNSISAGMLGTERASISGPPTPATKSPRQSRSNTVSSTRNPTGPNDRIRLLTFNTWGLKYISHKRELRLRAIADRIAQNHYLYDIIALQEVWVKADWEYFIAKCGQHFPHHRLFYSGIISGPGLAVLSRWPIESSFLYRFPINGRPSAFFRGDWYVGKSASISVISHPNPSVPPIALLNAHMHAPYGTGDAAYTCHRSAQAWDFARIAKLLADSGKLTIIVGDLNSTPGSFAHRLFSRVAHLSDAWVDRHGPFDYSEVGNLGPEDQVSRAGCTCDSVLNTYRAQRHMTEAKRLDYVFYDSRKASVEDARVSFTNPIPGLGSYSDHFALVAELKVGQAAGRNTPGEEEMREEILDTEKLYNDLLELIQEYRETSLRQRKYRTWHFYASAAAVGGLTVGNYFASRGGRSWLSFIFVFLIMSVGITGVVDLMIGQLFGRGEWRNLMEFEAEVELAKEALERRRRELKLQ